MPIRKRGAAFSAIVCFLHLKSVGASPSLNFPVNLQVPPVARVSQQFSFTFAESTFFISGAPVSYSLLNEPSWLHFDSDSRTFFGNVTTEERGPTKFELLASDISGSTSHEVTFIVTDQRGPQPGEALLPQLGKVGSTSAPASLLLYPLELFSITFTLETFSDTTEDTTFYATSADNSPLPSWLQFDPTSLKFSGTSPPLVPPTAKPQEYGVRLIASDIAGFAEAVTVFQMVIGYQKLAFTETTRTVEVSQGEMFETAPVRQDLTLDGNSVNDALLASITSNAPTWAILDVKQIVLSGTLPQDATTQSVLIQVADILGNTANTTIDLVVSSGSTKLFNSSLTPVNATIGEDFRYTIDSDNLSNNDVQVTVDLSNASSWLTYDGASRTISGAVPLELQPGSVIITLNATLESAMETVQLILNILENQKQTPTPSDRTSRRLPSPTDHSNTDSSSTSNERPQGNNRTLVILLGVLVPLLGLFCLGIIVFYYCRRRRQHRERSGLASEKYISRPVITPEAEHLVASDLQSVPQVERTPTPTSPPRIELPWAPDSLRKSRERFSKITANGDSALVDSGWGDFVIREPPMPARGVKRADRTTQDTPGDPGDWTPFVRNVNDNLNYSRKRTPLRPIQGKVQKPSFSSRASKTLSGLSNMSVGLPARLSGAGHGAGGPVGFREVRRSWRNTVDSFASLGGRTTPFDLDAFPEPPGGQKGRQEEQREVVAKATVRLVSSSSSHSGSLVEQRQRWVRDRARDRLERGSRFSHAWSSKAHSRAKGLDSSIRSPSGVKPGSVGSDDLLHRRKAHRSWSQSSSIRAPIKPEDFTRMKSPESHLVRHPSNLRRTLSTVSSGRFDSAESKSNSSWIDDLIEEEDEDGRRRWVAVEKPGQENVEVASPGLREGGESEQGSWGKNSRTGGLGALRANIQGGGPTAQSGERKWKLGGQQAKRPVSVDEGELQRSQGSQRGNLAFV